MRLIDADALHSNFFDYSPREMVWDRGDVEHKINEMPTIGAIPVGWLIDRANGPERAPLYRRYAKMLYEEWQKEQEAQK